MNSKQLDIFRTLLFIGGLVIVGVTFGIVNYPLPENGLAASQKFFWTEIIICYLVFFVPFFFSSITSKTIDTKITSTVNIWISVIVFEIVAIIFAILALNEKVSIQIAILVELIVFFFAAIFLLVILIFLISTLIILNLFSFLAISEKYSTAIYEIIIRSFSR